MNLNSSITLRNIPVKKTVLSIGIAAFLFGIFIRTFRKTKKCKANVECSGKSSKIPGRRTLRPNPWLFQNGDVAQLRLNASPGKMRNGSVSLSSEIYSSTSTLNTVIDGNAMTPQQIGLMGMEALETAINYWEDAISAYNFQTASGGLAIPSCEESKFSHAIQEILTESFKLQNKCEQLFLNQGSVLFRSDSYSTISRDNQNFEYDRRTFTSMSSIDSFVSAQAEIADLSDFDEFIAEVDVQKLSLYQTALDQHENEGIPYRTLRTDMLKCSNDLDYLVKTHCLRLAFQYIFKDIKLTRWFSDNGRQLISKLLIKADKDPKDFFDAYDSMLEFIQEPSNHSKSFEELQTRGVKCMSFYDVVLDYILLDAFEDLESPPSTVKAVIQNRWLSVSFKETALATAVWSVLKAKRRILKYSDGFISHFYDISEQISPVLAWGFLGSDEELRDLCIFFKDQTVNFLETIFNLRKVRFTTVEDLAQDVLNEAQLHFEVIHERLSL